MKSQIIKELEGLSEEQLDSVLKVVKNIKKIVTTTNDQNPFKYGDKIQYMDTMAIVQTNEGAQGIVKVEGDNHLLEMWEWTCDNNFCHRV